MSEKVAIRRLATGVPGLDAILGGGLPEFSFNLIARRVEHAWRILMGNQYNYHGLHTPFRRLNTDCHEISCAADMNRQNAPPIRLIGMH